jgi:hypothetical protein
MSGYRDRLTDHQLKELQELEFQSEVEENIERCLGIEYQRVKHHFNSKNPIIKSVYDRYLDSKHKLSVFKDAIRTITMNARHEPTRKSFSRSHSFSRSRSIGGTRRHKRKRN